MDPALFAAARLTRMAFPIGNHWAFEWVSRRTKLGTTSAPAIRTRLSASYDHGFDQDQNNGLTFCPFSLNEITTYVTNNSGCLGTAPRSTQ